MNDLPDGLGCSEVAQGREAFGSGTCEVQNVGTQLAERRALVESLRRELLVGTVCASDHGIDRRCGPVDPPGVAADLLKSDRLRGPFGECQQRLESYMVPKYIELIDHLPTTTSGKISKTGLS